MSLSLCSNIILLKSPVCRRSFYCTRQIMASYRSSQCLNKGIVFIDKRVTFSIEIDFKPSVDSKRVKVGLC